MTEKMTAAKIAFTTWHTPAQMYQLGFNHATDGKEELPFEALAECAALENADAYAAGYLDGLIVLRAALLAKVDALNARIGGETETYETVEDAIEAQEAAERAAAHGAHFGNS